jgi:hypothetical protein
MGTLIQRSASTLGVLGSYGFETGHFNDAAEDFIKSSSNKSLTQRSFIHLPSGRAIAPDRPAVAKIHHFRKISCVRE